MRLTQIKLAGFKSFVDPTTIPVPGNLVGIVGPNGCGKSNVIDAVRWVLGESSARHLRGETMQDVIFNGSSERKPVARASVELAFDNSLGRAAGQWSQYAEITVKRVLQRNGESSYFINNLHVRRRDVTDIFLGTGLGARAYGIIEQGMISRIVEARPEELRIFLEEAAGVSKYKERRRETELRLRDTRENLTRVDDIRQELVKQLQRLESQAQIAQQYNQLQQQQQTTQNLLWLLKKREAQAQWERARQEVQRLANEIEAETARLRQLESQLEQARAEHYAASDALHALQGEMYAANAEVAKLEQQLQHQRERRQRLDSQIAALLERQAELKRQRDEAQQNIARWQEELVRAQQQVAEFRQRLEAEQSEMPLAEENFRGCERRHAELQRDLAQAVQAQQVEETHRAHAEKALQQLQLRRERLEAEKQALPHPAGEDLNRTQGDLEAVTSELERLQSELALLQERQPQAEEKRRDAQQQLQDAQQQLARLEARLHAVQQLQERLDHDEKLRTWLTKHQLDKLPRLWSCIRVEAGWENALEGALGERLNAFLLNDLGQAQQWQGDIPPATVTVCEPHAEVADAGSLPGLVPLRQYVTWKSSSPAAPEFPLDEWLRRVYVVDSYAEGLRLRLQLPADACLVCREGHVLTRHSISFYAPQSELHGVLSRQREIEQLRSELAAQQGELELRQSGLLQAEGELAQTREALADLGAKASQTQQQRHQLQMEAQRLTQQQQHTALRGQQIENELLEIEAHAATESETLKVCEQNLKAQQLQIEVLQEHLQDAGQERAAAESRLNRQREMLQAAERESQEAVFNEKNCHNKIKELESFISVLDEQFTSLGSQLETMNAEQRGLDEEPLKLELQQALAARQEKEQLLGQSRDRLAGATNNLQEIERQRLQSEQALHPLRERLGESRLKEQETRLNEEQLSEQLRTAGANEEELGQSLEKGTRPSALQAEIARLNAEIGALGPVNLAALTELQTEQERKNYLDAQADDLKQAVETLEQAIRRIDRETRERLQETFDQVNRHFSELFPAVFGGGRARLELTGSEILDAGLQLIAQPPGKRNTSIHLLSGGEKALTALALVFSLFQLNPAPFCLLDEVDAPLDDTNTERFCELVRKMTASTQFIFISHNKITMEIAQQLVGVTMRESGVSRIVAVDIEEALRLKEEAVA